MDKGRVVVVGSANMDLVVQAPRFPGPGETILGSGFATFPGGKGANQAAAIGRLGGKVSLLGKVGRDGFGDALLESLQACGVATQLVLRDEGHPSGIAAITVAEGGENTIVVAPGANGALRPEEVRRGLGEAAFEVLLAQLEVPIGCLIAAAEAAEGRVFVLNPAPAQALPDELLCRVDYLTPNEREAAMLSGVAPTDDESCLEAARPLLARGVGNVLITLGERGSFLATPQGGQHFPTIAVRPVDTTAAGDAFNGALAYFLAQGHEPKNAILLANRVGALSTTKRGAQDSMPSLDELREVAADLL